MVDLSHLSRVLLIEDEALIALDIEMALRQAGVEEVVTAFTINEALGTLDQKSVCAAILDLHLAEGASHEVARRLHATGIPFMFSSGDAAGVAEFQDVPMVKKPFSSDIIVAALGDLVRPGPVARHATG